MGSDWWWTYWSHCLYRPPHRLRDGGIQLVGVLLHKVAKAEKRERILGKCVWWRWRANTQYENADEQKNPLPNMSMPTIHLPKFQRRTKKHDYQPTYQIWACMFIKMMSNNKNLPHLILYQPSKYEHAHPDKKEKQAELLVTAVHCVGNRLEMGNNGKNGQQR